MCPLVNRKLLIHHLFQRGIVHSATEEVTIDEEARSTRQPQTLALLQVLLYKLRHVPVVETFVEAVAVQIECARMFFQVRNIKGLAAEKDVMVLPKLTLRAGTARRFRGLLCAMVHGKRKVLEGNCDLVAVFLPELLQPGRDLFTVRAFIVGKLNQNDLCIAWSAYVRVGEIDISRRRHQQNADVGLLAQSLHIGGSGFGAAQLADVLQHLHTDCLVRLLRIQSLVVDLQLIFGGIFNLLVDLLLQQLVHREMLLRSFISQKLIVDEIIERFPLIQVVLIPRLEELPPFLLFEVTRGKLMPTDLSNDLLAIDTELRFQVDGPKQKRGTEQ